MSVVVVGSANQDLTSYTAVLPTLGQTVMGSSFATSCGGKGANQACAAAVLTPTTMICRVGDDVFGKALLENLSNAGVKYDEKNSVLQDKAISTGVASIVVDTVSGDNMIIVSPGANHALTPGDVETALRSQTQPPSVIMVQLEIQPDVALQALKTGKELNAITMLNPAPAPEGFTLDEFYQYTDYITPNETELRKICGETEDAKADDATFEESLAKELLAKGISRAVIVTLGARGAMIVDKTETTMVCAPVDLPCHSDPIVDTIGAGDGFCGALASYLSAGIELNKAATMACGFAGMAVRRKGATYPRVDELPDCLKFI